MPGPARPGAPACLRQGSAPRRCTFLTEAAPATGSANHVTPLRQDGPMVVIAALAAGLAAGVLVAVVLARGQGHAARQALAAVQARAADERDAAVRTAVE